MTVTLEAVREVARLVAIARQAQKAAEEARQQLRQDCLHGAAGVIEAVFYPVVAEEYRSTCRLCTICGYSERFTNGYRCLREVEREVTSAQYMRQVQRLRRELGWSDKDISYGTT